MGDVIRVDGLVVDRGGRRVLDGLSFAVPEGQTYGFLGANGAGKTTTIRALLGLLEPTEGKLLIHGASYDPSRRGLVGYLPEERGLFRKETVLDVMVFFGRVHGLSARDARRQALGYLERCGLGGKATTRIDRLSGGQQQKVQLGVTILGTPRVLILDEPTKGLDPLNRRLLVDVIDERRREGATVLLVTHDMTEVERSCDGVVLLKDGQTYASGSLDSVRGSGEDLVRVVFRGSFPDDGPYDIVERDGDAVVLRPRAHVSFEMLMRFLCDRGVQAEDFGRHRPSLEDVFLQLYEWEPARDSGEMAA